MTQTDMHTATGVARSLNFILLAVMIFLAIICVCSLLLALGMAFDNPVKDAVLTEVQQGASATGQTKSFALAFIYGAIIAGAYLYVVRILRAVVKTLLSGDPFVPENISRLRVIWIVLAISEVFRMIIHSPATSSLRAGVEADLIDIRLGAWFLVFVIAALAEVFRHGAELRRDQQLTV